MTARFFSIQPQRHNSKGWADCPPERATAWQVVGTASLSSAVPIARFERYESKRTARERATQRQSAANLEARNRFWGSSRRTGERITTAILFPWRS